MRSSLLGAAAAAGGGVVPLHGVYAQQAGPMQGPPLPRTTIQVAQAAPVATLVATTPPGCTGTPDPYKNYACMDSYLGTNPFERLYNYYRLEWGEAGPPTDPNAPPGRRDYWPATPETVPPMPFTEWPYGGTTPLGVTRTGSVDSPLMVAIANTTIGQWLQLPTPSSSTRR